jgi:hypothetical protein
MVELWTDYWVNPAKVVTLETTGRILRVVIDGALSRTKEYDSTEEARAAAARFVSSTAPAFWVNP